MKKALYSTNPHMLGFYEYVIVGQNHEMKQLKRIPEPKRRPLVMKNMSMFLTSIPQEYDKLRNARFKYAHTMNSLTLHNTRSGKVVTHSPKHIEKEFRHLLAMGNHLARYAKKQYKEFPIMQTMSSQLLNVVQVYREHMDHTFLFGEEDKTLEQHFDSCAKELDHDEQEVFKHMVAPHMKKLKYLMETKIDCAQFEKAVLHMLDVLLEQDIQTQAQNMYTKLFLCVLSQLTRNKYASCLSRVQHKFYLLNQKIS